MTENPVRTKLIEATENFWKEYDSAQPIIRLSGYVQRLLAREMDYAQRKGNRLPNKSFANLVLMVGHSIEPLLQSIWAYNPQTVYLVLNKKYGLNWEGTSGWKGRHQFGLIQKLVRQVEKIEAAELHSAIHLEPLYLKTAAPQEVFQTLLENIANCDDVIIDITGAKKSMVTGAYLYAAFANVPVSYVDFADDAYVPKKRRPYGFDCIFRQFDNPYEAFALREWERVSQLYQDYLFDEALKVLRGDLQKGIPGAAAGEYFSKLTPKIERLERILECYAHWQAGDYIRALALAAKIDGFAPPEGVQQLGPDWVQTEGFKFQPPNSFYSDDSKVKAYAVDEFNRIGRLSTIHNDYRSAFLRAGGLNEILLIKRLVDAAPSAQRERIANSIFDEFLRAKDLFSALKDGGRIKLKEAGETVTIPQDSPTKTWYSANEEKWNTFREIRNKLTHTYASVPPEWANDALNFVQSHLEDLWPNLDFKEIPDIGMKTSQPSGELTWAQVLELTSLLKHLPPNLRD